jgi:hypothetical protein
MLVSLFVSVNKDSIFWNQEQESTKKYWNQAKNYYIVVAFGAFAPLGDA